MTGANQSLVFRRFAPDDLSRLQEIRAAAFVPIFQSFRDLVGPEIAAVAFANAEREQATLLDQLCAAETEDIVIVAVDDARIVGFCGYRSDAQAKVSEIVLTAVDPHHQAQGVGEAMFDYVLQTMRMAGMRIATVGTGADASHAPARRAYEKVGFNRKLPNVYYFREL